MSDKELLAQIAQLAGAINKHNMNMSAATNGYGYTPGSVRGGYSVARGRGGPLTSFRGRGRGGSRPSRHLTLNVKANNSAGTPTSTSTTTMPPQAPINTVVGPGSTVSVDMATGQQWVQSKGKNMSLMTAEKYKTTMVAKQKSILSMKRAKLKAKQARAKRMHDLRKGIVTIGDTSYAKSADGRKLVINKQRSGSIVIDGIEFEMDARGNKLVRKDLVNNNKSVGLPASLASTTVGTSHPTPVMSTPKALSMDGVKYVRTTSGNLVRASLVRSQLLKKQARQKELAERRRLAAEKKKAAREKIKSTYCKFFTRLGRCPKGPRCPFKHSRDHLAICKKFLRGQCSHTAATCRLSHSPSPHTVPPCVHFQRAACTKDNCLYPHIRINPKAPLCVPFAKEGWCDKGGACKDRHAWICPDFNTPQGCHRRCGLAHVPEQGANGQQSNQQKSQQASQRRERYHKDNGNASQVQRGQQEASLESKSGSAPEYDENFIPLNLDSDDESELFLQPDIQDEQGSGQAQDQDARSLESSDDTDEEGDDDDNVDENEGEESDVEEMDVDSDSVLSTESDDDMDEEEDEDEEAKGPDYQASHHQPYDEDDDNEEEDEDDYMAYYQDEEEEDRGEY
ncbi:hypothetical protein BGW41_004587 [Actinomortierella wolfii]|nr:hypothetical protein BGW41_004587 [Actinomortierella wolfii]